MNETADNDGFDALVARIDEQSRVARANWFGLLAFLSFVGVSLLAVEDADFFIPARQVDLPIVGVAIPTKSFFWFAPLLGAALYVYLHIHLTKLWRHLVTARRAHGGQRVHDAVLPWLVNDLVLTTRGERAAERHPISALSNATTFALIWLAGPLVLAGFWWRSMPAHDEWLTLFVALCLVVALNAGTRSWRRYHALLKTGEDAEPGPGRRIVGGAFPVILLAVSWLRTEGGFEHYRCAQDETCPDPQIWWSLREAVPLAPINLANVAFTLRPADWRAPEVAQRSFMSGWCAQRNLPLDVCNPIPAEAEEEARLTWEARVNWCQLRSIGPGDCRTRFTRVETAFADDFWEERAAWRSTLPTVNLRGADLRRADLSGAFLPNADLRQARLENSSLSAAILEGSNLAALQPVDVSFAHARLEQSDAEGVQFTGTFLRGVQLDRADLVEAQFTDLVGENVDFRGANLAQARFLRVGMPGARLDRTTLTGTDFKGANLHGSTWNGAQVFDLTLDGVRLRKADMTALEMFDPSTITARHVLADEDARLPDGIEAMSCLAEPLDAAEYGELFQQTCSRRRMPERVGQASAD